MSLNQKPNIIKLTDVDQIKSTSTNGVPETQKEFIKKLGQQNLTNDNVQALTLDQVEAQYPGMKGMYDNHIKPQLIKNKVEVDSKDIKVLVFPAIGIDDNWDGCQKGSCESFPLFFTNFNGENQIISNGTSSHGPRPTYFNLVTSSNACQVVENNYVIAGHCGDNLIFKIPWKQEWGKNGLPESKDVNGFNRLYEKIKQQQNQTANINNNPTFNQMTQKNITTTVSPAINVNTTAIPTVPKIAINVEYGGVKHMIVINSNKTMSDLRREIGETVGKQNFELTYNAIKLNMDDNRQLSSVFPGQCMVNLTVNNAVQTQQNQNFQNQMIQNNDTTQGDKMITIGFGYNSKLNRFQIDPNTPISELIMQIRKKVNKENVEVIYRDKYGNQKKLNVNSRETLASFFGDKKEVYLTVNDKKIGIQTTQNKNNNQTNVNNAQPALLRSNFDNRLSASGTTMVNKLQVPVLRPAQPPFVRPLQVVPRPVTQINNNPFGGQTTIFDGQTTGAVMYSKLANSAPRPVTTRAPVVRPPFGPAQFVRPSPFGPVPRPMTTVRPPVVPVPQSGDGLPQRNTLHQAVSYNPSTGATHWRGTQTLEIPNNQTYQEFIDYFVKNDPDKIYTMGQQWQPRYQYIDELGMAFTSDRPIFKDANNNLVTLGHAEYGLP